MIVIEGASFVNSMRYGFPPPLPFTRAMTWFSATWTHALLFEPNSIGPPWATLSSLSLLTSKMKTSLTDCLSPPPIMTISFALSGHTIVRIRAVKSREKFFVEISYQVCSYCSLTESGTSRSFSTVFSASVIVFRAPIELWPQKT